MSTDWMFSNEVANEMLREGEVSDCRFCKIARYGTIVVSAAAALMVVGAAIAAMLG